ncbi:MAG: glycine oxidase ThiO [Candidatus Omnitrophica bacterium]|nr:glycine oxidase ThiO [Candidatus Omnitrophota bacterium]
MIRVAVVGGGIVGLAAAAELAGRGVEVDLLERNPEPGQEASWAAAGILSPHGMASLGSEPFLKLLAEGYRKVPGAVSRIREETGFDVGARATGMFGLALTAQDEQELITQDLWERSAGLEIEDVPEKDLRHEEPAVDGPVRRASWYPQVTKVDVRRFVEGYTRLVRSRGGKIRTGVTVTRFLIEAGRAAGVETSEGEVRADCVVNCAGSWAGFDGSLPFVVPAVPARGQILQLATVRPLVRGVVHSPRGYLVQRSDSELIAGTTVENVGFDKRVTEEGARSIRAGVAEFCSRTAGLSVAAQWAGLRPDTPDHLPVLGRSPVEGLLLAAGHFRNGVILAPLTGQAIADLALTGESPVDLSAFSVKRFTAKAVKCSAKQGATEPCKL